MNSNHKHEHECIKPKQEAEVIQAIEAAPELEKSPEPVEVAVTEPVIAETEPTLRQSLKAANVTYMRCLKVEKVLENDTVLREKLGPKEIIIYKFDGTAQKFSAEVIAIIRAIHEQDVDVHTMNRREIRWHAMQLFSAWRSGKPTSPKESS